jgi:hypothetical protein
VCFWIEGIGFSIDERALNDFMGGDHFLARLADRALDFAEDGASALEHGLVLDQDALARSDALQGISRKNVRLSLDPGAATADRVTFVGAHDSCSPLWSELSLLPIIFDFIARRRTDPHCHVLNVVDLPRKGEDAAAVDRLQHFLFGGTVYRHPATFYDETTQTIRARVALFPNMVIYEVHPSTTTKSGVRRVKKITPLARDDLERLGNDMALDPLWTNLALALARNPDADTMPRSAAMEIHSAAFRTVLGDGSSVLIHTNNFDLPILLRRMHADAANRMPVMLAANILYHHYTTTLSPQGIVNIAKRARIVEVERGVVLRVATVSIERQPGNALAPNGYYETGHMHVIRYRAEERPAVAARVQNFERQTSVRGRVRYLQAKNELDALDRFLGWRSF